MLNEIESEPTLFTQTGKRKILLFATVVGHDNKKYSRSLGT